MWFLPGILIRVVTRRRARTRARRSPLHAKHYAEHKERAREVIHERLSHWNQFYGLTYGRVAIRNTRSRWGSCSTKGNLNFNYKLVFLPEYLIDYVVVHELCHLIEFNHSKTFWDHVARAIPDHRERIASLKQVNGILLTSALVGWGSTSPQVEVPIT